MILVTGATGTIGGEVAAQLLAAGERVRVLARDPAKVAKLGAGVEVAQGDLSKPETLTTAFEGIEKVFLLATGPDLANFEAHAITAAKRASVKHIVKLSAMGAELEPGIQLGRWHRESEKNLEESGLAWTILRAGNFASNALSWAPSIKAQGQVYHLTGAGKSAPIDPRDIAAVAVVALTKPDHEGQIYTLTGPEALTAAEQVEKIGTALGKRLQAIDAPEAAARSGMLAEGMPREFVEAVLELMALAREGHTSMVTNTVAKVLGREPRSFDAWVKDNIAAFR